MENIDVGSRTKVSELQNWKEYPDILTTFEPMVTESNPEHSRKAAFAMLVMVVLIEMSPLQQAFEGSVLDTQSAVKVVGDAEGRAIGVAVVGEAELGKVVGGADTI